MVKVKEKTYKNFKDDLKISKKYSELIPQLSSEKFNMLKKNIKEDGVIHDPIIVDENGFILDGHHRYKIAEQLDIPYKTQVQKVKKDKERLWLAKHQIGRREMSKDQRAVLGLAFIGDFSKICKDKQSEGGKTKKSGGKPLIASEMVAKEMGVNALIMKYVISVNAHIPEFIPFIRNGEYTVNDGKYLQKYCPEGYIVDGEGKLTKTAKNLIKEFNTPFLSKKDKMSGTIRTSYSCIKETEVMCNLQPPTDAELAHMVEQRCSVSDKFFHVISDIVDCNRDRLKEDRMLNISC